ncbi:TonB-dependent siderophore receptor [Massilia sp. HP4]|uniref:TonB-dependent receptor plug domain-containing protein n=1 Tax=Massilia sp. HP4 TaxID=2562316 RepID=UPI001484FA61|nr:TonB-dependent receptor [Massilia sp. HP4]
MVFSLGILSAFPAHAKQEDAPTDQMAKVAVRGSADSERRNEATTRIVVDRDDLDKYGDRSILDVLKRQPGVTVANNDIRMRGLGGGYTQVLVNGDRPPAGFSLDTLAPESIARIEIMRAATAELSTQGIAGTINIILKRSASRATREIIAGVGGAASARYPALTVNASDRLEKYAYTVGATLNHSDNGQGMHERVQERRFDESPDHLRATDSRNANRFTSLNANSRLQWESGEGDKFAWQTFVNAARSAGTSEQATVVESGPRYPYPLLLLDYDGKNENIRSDLSWARNLGEEGKLDTRLGLYRSGSDRGMSRLGLDGASSAALDRRYETGVDDKGGSWTGKVSAAWATRHAIAVGWDAGYSDYRENEVQREAVASTGSAPINFNNTYRARITRLALYVQDEWDIAPGWSIYLGMRWEGLETRTGGDAEGFKRRSSVLSPLIQTLWKIPGSKNDQIRLAVTRTYKAPELRQLIPRHFYTSYNFAVSPDQSGNPQLEPELATGIDAAFEHYWTNNAMASVSVGERKVDGLIRNAIRYDGERWLAYPVNSGKATVRSLELETKFPITALLSAAPAIQLRANLARNWSQVDAVPGPDNRLDRQPEWSANLGADYKRGNMTVGASLSMVAGGWTRL